MKSTSKEIAKYKQSEKIKKNYKMIEHALTNVLDQLMILTEREMEF